MAFYDDNTPDAENVPAGPQFGSADYNFDFLDKYIQQLGKPTRTNPNQSLDDGDNFYIEDDEEQEGSSAPLEEFQEEPQSPDGSAGFTESSANDYLFASDASDEADYIRYNRDEENMDENETSPDSAPFDSFPTFNNGFSFTKSERKTPFVPTGSKRSLGEQIGEVESGGKYSATNKNSSAVGKYQFLWGTWGDSIKKVTGVKSKEDFLKNPNAQEQYYAFYEKSVLQPNVEKLKKQIPTDLSDTQLAKLIHFRGQAGAKKYLLGQIGDKPEAYNMNISEYIGKKQTGGVAVTPEEQYVGLNNPTLDNLFLPLKGTNLIRGLDDGSPVEVIDEEGTRKILYGPKHTFKAKGSVREKRLKN